MFNKLRKPDGDPLEVYHYIFMYITIMFGLSFTLFSSVLNADESVLYKATTIHLTENVTSVWGVACLITVSLVILALYFEKYKWVPHAIGGVFSCWLYAIIMYATDQFWFGILVGALPNAFYWAYTYIMVSRQLKPIKKS